MKRKRVALILGILLLGAFGAGGALRRGAATEESYATETVQRGSIENTVTGTGAIGPVGSVEVGTQVSGTIARVFVDYNDEVREGDLLAVLDTTLLSLAIGDAEAEVRKAEALHEEAEADRERTERLAAEGLLSEQDLVAARTAAETSLSGLLSAWVALSRARTNRDYALIRSPVSGTVIERNVEEGQTVAASLSTPTLFVIAEDLSAMRILAEVDESDIGAVREGQEARFTVLSYPDETFIGEVSRVRLQPATVSNVVNYTVEVSAANDRGLLLPGMTATVDFVVEKRESALLVPNAALRLRPTKEMTAALRDGRRGQDAAPRAGLLGEAGGGTGAFGFPPSGEGDPPEGASVSRSRIWTVDDEGKLAVLPVETGITDGKSTEIIDGRIEEGTRVVTGTSASNEESGESRPGGGGFGPRRPF